MPLTSLGTPSYSLVASIANDSRPLPPPASTPAEDDELFTDDPWVVAPIHADYGCNVKLGIGAFVNFNATFVDTCPISIGARTLVGPNCSFFSGTHPLDPAVRMGTTGPELGKPIEIGEDCWFGGNVIVLPGITIGRGCSIGAGSVVTKVSTISLHGISSINAFNRIFPLFMLLPETQLEFCERSRPLWILLNLPQRFPRIRSYKRALKS